MEDPQGKAREVRRLLVQFRTAPNATNAPEQVLTGYLLAVERWDLADVTAAVAALIVGDAPGVHKGFLPTSAELGGECRRQHNLNADRIALERRLHPPAPAPFQPKDPESRARVAALVDAYVEEHRPENDNEYWQHGPLPPVGGYPPGENPLMPLARKTASK